MILLKMGELVLKGLNRPRFEQKLVANARRRLPPYGEFKVWCRQSTVYIEPKNDECDIDGAFEAMPAAPVVPKGATVDTPREFSSAK